MQLNQKLWKKPFPYAISSMYNIGLATALRSSAAEINANISIPKRWSCIASIKPSSLSEPTYVSTPHQLQDPLLAAKLFSTRTAMGKTVIILSLDYDFSFWRRIMEIDSMHFKATLARKWDLLEMRDVWIITASCRASQSKESGKILRPLRSHIKH